MSNGQESLEVKLSREMGATLELRKGIMIEQKDFTWDEVTNVNVKGHYQETMFGDFIFRTWIIFYDRMKCTKWKISGQCV